MSVDLDELRALLRDDDVLVWTDENLEAAISATGDVSILRAAGQAVQSLAIEYAMQGRSIRTDDLAVDQKGRGADLLAVAKSFFDQASAADAVEAADHFEIVSFSGRPSARSCRVEGSPYPCSHGYYCGRC